MSILLLLLALEVKHFVVDFPLQTPYQWQNKGTYGHPGGLLHALLHAIPTFIILLFFVNDVEALALSIFEMVIHYHIDWAKMNVNKAKGWECNKHSEFWVLLGFDQLLHQLTYLAIAWAVIAL